MTATTKKSRTLAWSLAYSLVVLNSFMFMLSPSTAGGVAHAALKPGFCGDCQTFSNAIGVCGGTFGPPEIEVAGEYVLQQVYANCICTEVMQKVLWTCARCESLAGKPSKAPPPQKYQTQCMSWGINIDQWKAPYTGVVAPDTQTDLNGGNTDPNPNPNPTQPTFKPTG
ncbi:hypothetical protein BGZ65_000650, partial [Modicella reniformis]